MRLILFVILAFLFSSTSFADRRCLDDVCFDPSVEIDGKTLLLRGVALFEYYKFDVYTGAFYAEEDVDTTDEALQPRHKHLILQYHRSLKKSDFAENSEYILDKNPNLDRAKLKPQFDKLYDMYQTVEKGDRYSLSYEPNRGMILYLNGKEVGVLEGEEFQSANFGIWLSDYSVGKKFTRKLLGN